MRCKPECLRISLTPLSAKGLISGLSASSLDVFLPLSSWCFTSEEARLPAAAELAQAELAQAELSLGELRLGELRGRGELRLGELRLGELRLGELRAVS